MTKSSTALIVILYSKEPMRKSWLFASVSAETRRCSLRVSW